MTIDSDPLDRLAPSLPWQPDWTDVLQRAGTRERRRPWFTRRRLLVALAVLVAVLVPLAALAAEHDWWFLSQSGIPKPASSPVVVMEGTWSGRPWHVVAYRTRTEGVCVGMVADLTRISDAGLGCGPLLGEPHTYPSPPGGDPKIAAGLGSGGENPVGTGNGRQLPAYVLGQVVDTARIVEVRFITGDTVRSPAVAAPASIGSVRFFAAPLPKRVERLIELTPRYGGPPVDPFDRLTGYDAQGNVVACGLPDSYPPATPPLSACR